MHVGANKSVTCACPASLSESSSSDGPGSSSSSASSALGTSILPLPASGSPLSSNCMSLLSASGTAQTQASWYIFSWLCHMGIQAAMHGKKVLTCCTCHALLIVACGVLLLVLFQLRLFP